MVDAWAIKFCFWAFLHNLMAVRVIEQSRVSPTPPVDSSRLPIPLTFFDIIWLNSVPVERLFFFNFPHTTSHFLQSHLPLLKSSLSLTLAEFYPLVGTIRLRPGSDHHFEISFTETDSIPLTISEFIGGDFTVLSGDKEREVTLFPSQGLCLALTVHHAACDGQSSTHFVKSWAAAFRSSTATPSPHPKPYVDCSVIQDPRDFYSLTAKLILDIRAQKKTFSSTRTAASIVLSTFTIDAVHISMLKQRAQSSRRFHCSSYVVSCAFAWVCLLKTRGSVSDDAATNLIIAVDWRWRIRPRIPEAFFGNCIGSCIATARAAEIVGQDGFSVACEKIGTAIEGIGDDVHESMEGTLDKIVALLPTRPLTFAGSPKLRVYETDFGWGELKKVLVTSIGQTGAMSLAEMRNGDGGVEIGVVLTKAEMEKFTSHFVNGFES
ncbi:hypothetical protein HPP92_008420 [Vanilla planifolia]|uniref:Uncharacterized protein n=1 Tax=Vanilla planifolia TaxID=51239 RepID=A0A835R2G2_VANPL|nr:hypothetical protein HPP92_008420 [Vanilla planifolia]